LPLKFISIDGFRGTPLQKGRKAAALKDPGYLKTLFLLQKSADIKQKM
jgi:hypothetical protein